MIGRTLAHARFQFAELVSIPAFTVPSLGLPLLTYLIFGLPLAGGSIRAANAVLVGFSAFALLGIVMFQFGVGIAADRAAPWERFVRTLPVSGTARFGARLLVALVFGIAAVTPVCLCAVLATPITLDLAAWSRVLASMFLGVIPLGLLGIMLGYLLNERGALPVTNLIYLPLSYAGGLFSPNGTSLPAAVRAVSPWLPTRQWSDVLVQYGLEGRLPMHQLLALAAYGAAFAALAGYGYRRDEYRQYR